MARLTKKEAYDLGFEHGYTMAQEDGSSEAPSDGWDALLINADPSFVKNKFGWDSQDSDNEAKELLAEYCRGCQAGAEQACKTDEIVTPASFSVEWQFLGAATQDHFDAAQAVADSMEVLGTTEITYDVIESAVRRLGKGWDHDSVRAVLENCSFERIDQEASADA